MPDPRKPIQIPDEDHADMLRESIHDHLFEATHKCGQATGINGVCFVCIGIGVWGTEMYELNPKATSKFFEAMSVIFDPNSHPKQRARAEKKRASAVAAIYAAADLAMAEAEGSA